MRRISSRISGSLIKLFLYAFILLIFGVIVYTLLFLNVDERSAPIVATFIINLGICILNLFVLDSRIYSLNKIFWLFNLIFFCLIPFFQYVFNIFPWGSTFTPNDILFANVLLFFWFLIYSLIYYLTNDYYVKRKFNIGRSLQHVGNLTWVKGIMFLILALVILRSYISNAGFTNILSRGTNSSIEASSTTQWLLKEIITRSLLLYFLLFSILNFRLKKSLGSKIILVTSLLINLVGNFPTALARYMAASFYISIFLYFKSRWKNKHIFSLLFIAGLTILYPLLGAFRDIKFSQSANILKDFSKKFLFQAAVSGDFDAYSMFVNTIKYVHDFGVTFGLQLLGAIFFFVPRSIWPSKPVGSGALIAAKNGWLFTNVSCPLIGESYINFGLIGIIIFAIIYGIITSTLDNIYWSLNKVNLYNYWSLVYPVLLGMFFFHLRGDMLSSTAYTVGILVVGVITYYAMRLKLR